MASNSGNSGNSGNSANATSVSGGWFFADRVDIPFVTEFGSGVFIEKERLDPPRFPDRNWGAEWFAWRVLVEFAQTAWTGINLLDWTQMTGFTSVDDELDTLVRAAETDRADAIGEIISQADDFISYFMNLMTTTPSSYPKTARVLNAASLVALFVAMKWKGEYARPRPSQLCPALLPPLAVPGHASYPSGHSTQAHLIVLCMQAVFAGLPAAQRPKMVPLQIDLATLADRIAHNREIAGLHYPSDSEAGKVLAGKIFPLLDNMGATSPYKLAIADATSEWTW